MAFSPFEHVADQGGFCKDGIDAKIAELADVSKIAELADVRMKA